MRVVVVFLPSPWQRLPYRLSFYNQPVHSCRFHQLWRLCCGDQIRICLHCPDIRVLIYYQGSCLVFKMPDDSMIHWAVFWWNDHHKSPRTSGEPVCCAEAGAFASL